MIPASDIERLVKQQEGGMRVRGHYNPVSDAVELYAFENGMQGVLQLEPKEEGALSSPLLRLRLEEAQELINSLWSAGLRPIQGKQSEGVTAAQERHLNDMRRLVFTKFNIEEPK